MVHYQSTVCYMAAQECATIGPCQSADTSQTVKPRLRDTTCCQSGCPTGCIVYTNIQLVVTNDCIMYTAGCQHSGCSLNTVVKTGCTTG